MISEYVTVLSFVMHAQIPTEVQQWRNRGQLLSVPSSAGPLSLFYIDQGPPAALNEPQPQRETLVILHGFPTSSFDFAAVLALLSERFRVLLLDFVGFGLSSKPREFSYSLKEQADMVLAVCHARGIDRFHLLAHDMGTSVACELIARRELGALPITLQSVTLCNGSVYIEMAQLTPAQRLLRHRWIGPLFAKLANEWVFSLQLKRIFGNQSASSGVHQNDGRELTAHLHGMWWLLSREDGNARLPQIIRYIDERYANMNRWIAPLARLNVPTLVLWGDRDPVAVFAMAERLMREISQAKLVRLHGIGHYPMVEDPAQFARAVIAFVGSQSEREMPKVL
jgi:pimeloyl-ACP methyl ester carboxylesterase